MPPLLPPVVLVRERPRAPLERPRVVVPRLRVPLALFVVPVDERDPAGFAPPLRDAPVPADAADELVPVERLAFEPLLADRLLVEPVPAERALFEAVERDVPERDAVERDLVARAPDVPDPVDFERLVLPLPPLEAPLCSSVHLPDITRCAASATASAMIEPSRVALETTVLAACEAVSAASRPASRILRRAAGLALIAAAAAASPAASISRLIATLASLSTVVSLFFDDDCVEPEDVEEFFFLVPFAIANLPWVHDKDTSGA